jgi:hypothetical protein
MAYWAKIQHEKSSTSLQAAAAHNFLFLSHQLKMRTDTEPDLVLKLHYAV